MPKKSWFKHLWKVKKEVKPLKRIQRMKSFKAVKNKNITVKYIDDQGKDMSRYVKSSYVYDGVPGGFYIDQEQMKMEGVYY